MPSPATGLSVMTAAGGANSWPDETTPTSTPVPTSAVNTVKSTTARVASGAFSGATTDAACAVSGTSARAGMNRSPAPLPRQQTKEDEITDLEDLKVGDHASLTIKGTIYEAKSGHKFVKRDGENFSMMIMVYPEDEVELLPQPLPTKFGAIIRYEKNARSSATFAFDGAEWVSQLTGKRYSQAGLEIMYDHQPFEVIFEGTD